MISICIPIYNLDVTNLISDLAEQIETQNLSCEIVLIDDGSNKEYLVKNEAICNKHIYIKLPKNIGRSKIRNLFTQYVTKEHLLFLDCDSTITSSLFLTNYMDYISKKSSYNVVFGGSVYNIKKPKRNKMLRWKYGIEKESQPLAIRRLSPNNSFMTNNFLIEKKVFNTVKFDERIQKYGHEDTLFGYELSKNEYVINHMDNTVLNENIESNTAYLFKIELANKNLISILEYVNNDVMLIEKISLLRFYEKIKKLKLISIVYFLFILCKYPTQFLLKKGYVNINLFNFYKLGIFIHYKDFTNLKVRNN